MDDTARALGASAPGEMTINGKVGVIRPLTARELTEIERICVRSYRNEYLARLKDSVDIIGQDRLEDEVFKTANWDVHNLPRKWVFDPRPNQLTAEIIDWMVDNTNSDRVELLKNPIKALRALATVLDNEAMPPDLFEKLAGSPCLKLSTGYVNWWITATFEGMLELAFYSMRGCGITREDLFKEFEKKQELLWQVAREAEKVSSPSMGNGQDPHQPGETVEGPENPEK